MVEGCPLVWGLMHFDYHVVWNLHRNGTLGNKFECAEFEISKFTKNRTIGGYYTTIHRTILTTKFGYIQ